MSGSVTNGFDMVIEVSAQTIQNMLSGIFDNDGLLGSFLPAAISGFELGMSFNRPSGIPSDSVNPVDMSINLSFTNGFTGVLRIVAGMDVDRTAPDTDWVFLDFKNKLYVCDVTLNSFTIPGINTFVRNKLKDHPVKLIPIPVQRAGTGFVDITRADVKIIDDTAGAGNDALAVMLTFGGGTAGNMSAFTSAFAREGSGAAVAINFQWLCRNMSPRIESAIGLPAGSFTNCGFTGNHEIRDGVRLTSLSIAPAADSIRLSGTVAKSGFCYEASGTIAANIFVAVEAGRLKVSFSAEDPDLDINIPWYCWVAGVVIGAVLGGVLGGVVGSIVGAIIIPLILWIAQTVVESTVENIASQVTGSISGVNLDVPLVGVDAILDRAFIDDLTVGYNMFPVEYAPVRSEGTIAMRSGQYFDLDKGVVQSQSFGGADLQLTGYQQGRALKPLCGASLAYFTRNVSFNNVRRFHLYGLGYGYLPQIQLGMVATYLPLPFYSDQYVELPNMFAFKTTDGCYGILSVTDVSEDRFIIRYKVYESENFSIGIAGNFSCNAAVVINGDKIISGGIAYFPSKALNAKFSQELEEQLTLKVNAQLPAMVTARLLKSSVNPGAATGVNFNVSEMPEFTGKIKQYNRPVGKWIETVVLNRKKKSARFSITVNGTAEIASYIWSVDGMTMQDKSSGTINVKGVPFEYEADGKYLTLSSVSSVEVEIPLRAVAVTASGNAQTVNRCVNYKNECKNEITIVPGIKEYLDKFDSEYGVVRIPVKHNPTVKALG